MAELKTRDQQVVPVATSSTSKELVLRPRRLPTIESSKAVARAGGAIIIGRTPNPSYHSQTTFRTESDDFSTFDSVHTWWIGMPGYQRLYLYTAGFVVLALGYCWVTGASSLALFLLVLQVLVVAIWGGSLAWQLLPGPRHRRVYVKPLADVLNALFNREFTHHRNVTRVPRNFSDDAAEGIRVYLPAARLVDDQIKKKVQTAVSMKIGISELDAQWKTLGNRPYAVFKPKPRPPQSVMWDDVKDLALSMLSDSVIFIGLGRGRKPVCFDLGNESPHLAISGGSNSGKSVLLRTLLAQAAFAGARTVIFDVKRVSHKWAKNLAGVEYYRDVEQIHDALVSLAVTELRKRTILADNEENPGHRIFVVLEEMNTLMLQLRRYWRAMGEKGPSPAVEAISDLLCMGREVKINVVVAAQNLTARAIGGPEARENFSTRALARYSPQMWNMLCGDVRPMPPKARRVGVWQIVYAGEAHETQVAFMEPGQARDLVLSAIDPHEPTTAKHVTENTQSTMSEASVTVEAEVLATVLTTLEESASELGITYGNLRQLKLKDSSFPQSHGKQGKSLLYDLDELRAWNQRRDAGREARS